MKEYTTVSPDPGWALPTLSQWERISIGFQRWLVLAMARTLSLRFLHAFGISFAVLEWLTNYKRRRRFAANMRAAFGDRMSSREVRRACLRQIIRLRNDKLFFLIQDRLPDDEVRSRIKIVNQDLLDEGLARGKGVYLANAHLGSHHIANYALWVHGYKIGTIRDPKEGAVRRYIRFHCQESWGDRMRVFPNTESARTFMRWLGDNGLLISAMDIPPGRNVPAKTVRVTIYGENRDFLSGPMRIAAKAGSTALTMLLISRGGFRYELQIGTPLLDPATDENNDARVAEAMQRYADWVENAMRTHPCHLSRP